ncbi:uncharacterized protein LOC128338873 [Hemicordylus capensis]|uniref:uncharacterized protein LOC128338873 n=1 Tax=Hemicordylus capensis TaxID=884348 RepID=UPI0023046106|nr:uncharacterized protein LOC128338873 [Hemicordylus capensis]
MPNRLGGFFLAGWKVLRREASGGGRQRAGAISAAAAAAAVRMGPGGVRSAREEGLAPLGAGWRGQGARQAGSWRRIGRTRGWSAVALSRPPRSVLSWPSCGIDPEDMEVVESFCLLGLTVNSQGSSSQEIRCRLALGRVAMKALERILRCRDVSIPTKIRVVQTMVFPMTLYECESWTSKKQEKEEKEKEEKEEQEKEKEEKGQEEGEEK